MTPTSNGGRWMKCAFAPDAGIFFSDATFRCLRTRRCDFISSVLLFNVPVIGRTGSILSCTFDKTYRHSYCSLPGLGHAGARPIRRSCDGNCEATTNPRPLHALVYGQAIQRYLGL